MFAAISEFISTQQGDSAEFTAKARAIAIGVARDFEPARLYVIRIDNWFGPRWMHFAGTMTVGKVGRFPAIGFGVHKTRLHVPPFVPSRVIGQQVFVAPDFDETVPMPPLHIECPSKLALQRRIADIDKDAAFVWFSGESEAQKRGSVMVYLPVPFDPKSPRRGKIGRSGAFYIGFSLGEIGWKAAMLRGVSPGEVAHLEQSYRTVIDNSPLTAIR